MKRSNSSLGRQAGKSHSAANATNCYYTAIRKEEKLLLMKHKNSIHALEFQEQFDLYLDPIVSDIAEEVDYPQTAQILYLNCHGGDGNFVYDRDIKQVKQRRVA